MTCAFSPAGQFFALQVKSMEVCRQGCTPPQTLSAAPFFTPVSLEVSHKLTNFASMSL